MVFLALSGFCVSCSQIEDPFAHIKQLHQAEGESIDRKEEDPPFSPPPPHRLDPPHYFWEK